MAVSNWERIQVLIEHSNTAIKLLFEIEKLENEHRLPYDSHEYVNHIKLYLKSFDRRIAEIPIRENTATWSFDTSQPIHSLSISPLSLIVRSTISGQGQIEFTRHYHDEPAKLSFNPVENDTREWKFNPFDYFLSIKGLLARQHGGAFTTWIFQIYELAQSVSFLIQHSECIIKTSLKCLLDDTYFILGLCRNIFQRYSIELSRAYLIHHITLQIYGPGFPYCSEHDDWVQKWLREDHIHHGFQKIASSRNLSLDDLGRIHARLSWSMYKHSEAGKRYFRAVAATFLLREDTWYDHKIRNFLRIAQDGGLSKRELRIIKKILGQNYLCYMNRKNHETTENDFLSSELHVYSHEQ